MPATGRTVIDHLHTYAQRFPMTPMGGVFLAVMGLFVVLGAALPAQRQRLVWIGFGVGGLSLLVSGQLAAGLPAPSSLQMGSLACARHRRGDRGLPHFRAKVPPAGGERTAHAATLGIVALAWRAQAFRPGAAWGLDGAFKLTIGVLMITERTVVEVRATSPSVVRLERFGNAPTTRHPNRSVAIHDEVAVHEAFAS